MTPTEQAAEAARQGAANGAPELPVLDFAFADRDVRAKRPPVLSFLLRMDTLRAYGPAAEAFRRAIAAAPNEGIREDALARLIETLDAMGDRATCAEEQRRYQSRYPRGVHAAAVRSRCTSRK